MYDLSSKIHVGRRREDSDGGRGGCVAIYTRCNMQREGRLLCYKKGPWRDKSE